MQILTESGTGALKRKLERKSTLFIVMDWLTEESVMAHRDYGLSIMKTITGLSLLIRSGTALKRFAIVLSNTFNLSLNADRQQRLPLRGGVACLLVRR